MQKRDDGKPQILGSLDLTHINPGQRVRLVGSARWVARQQRLREICGAAAVCLIPQACGGGNAQTGAGGTPSVGGITAVIGGTGNDTPATGGDSNGVGGDVSLGGAVGSGGSNATGGSISTGGSALPPPDLAPTVTGADPIPGATIGRHPQHIRIVFSEPMNAATLQQAFTLSPAVPLQVTVDDTGTRVDLTAPGGTPLELEPKTTYTLTVAATAQDLTGNGLDGNRDGTAGDSFQLTLTTQGPPKIISTYPRNNATGALMGLFATVELDFDVPMNVSPVTVSVQLSPTPTIVLQPNKAAWRDEKTLILSGGMVASTKYTITIPGSIASLDGQALDGNQDGVGGDAYTLTFTTGTTIACSCQDYSASCSCEANTCSLDAPICPFDSVCATYGCLCEVQCSCQTYRV